MGPGAYLGTDTHNPTASCRPVVYSSRPRRRGGAYAQSEVLRGSRAQYFAHRFALDLVHDDHL